MAAKAGGCWTFSLYKYWLLIVRFLSFHSNIHFLYASHHAMNRRINADIQITLKPFVKPSVRWLSVLPLFNYDALCQLSLDVACWD